MAVIFLSQELIAIAQALCDGLLFHVGDHPLEDDHELVARLILFKYNLPILVIIDFRSLGYLFKLDLGQLL